MICQWKLRVGLEVSLGSWAGSKSVHLGTVYPNLSGISGTRRRGALDEFTRFPDRARDASTCEGAPRVTFGWKVGRVQHAGVLCESHGLASASRCILHVLPQSVVHNTSDADVFLGRRQLGTDCRRSSRCARRANSMPFPNTRLPAQRTSLSGTLWIFTRIGRGAAVEGRSSILGKASEWIRLPIETVRNRESRW